jgi:intracellular multiplication protein IcmQ
VTENNYEEERKQYALDLIKALNDALANPDWDKMLYLQALAKRLTKVRDNLKQAFEEEYQQSLGDEIVAKTPVVQDEDYLKVYVLLYNSEGQNLDQWLLQLTTLSTTLISRPIYRHEADAEMMIRSKANRENEAYCVAQIRKVDIAEPFRGLHPRDKLGQELLILKNVVLRPEAIEQFIHISGIYEYKNQSLIRLADAPFLR